MNKRDDADYRARDEGNRAAFALEAIAGSSWERSAELVAEAEALQVAGELTPDRAQQLLMSLLEQRKLVAHFKAKADAGVAAARRIDARAEAERVKREKAQTAERFGQNRFMLSKRPPPETA